MTLPVWARVGLVLFVALMLQLTLVNDIELWGVTGSVLVALPVAAGLVAGPERGALVGFAAGLAIDVFLTTPFGLTALVWTVTGHVTGVLGRSLLRSSRPTVVGIAALAALGAMVGFLLVGAILGQDHLLDAPVARITAVGVLVAAVAVLPAVPAMRWAMTHPHDRVPIRH